MSRFALAKERLVAAIDELVPELFGAGRRNAIRGQGGWYLPSRGSPRPAPDQMVVWRTGARRGGWKDFITGAQGDAIDLVAYVHEGIVTAESRLRAVAWAEERFGIRQMSAADRQRLEAAGEARRRAQAAAAEQSLARAREQSRKAFFAASPRLAATPVETYLAGRGIDLGQVPNLSAAFRYRSDAEYWLGAERDGEGRKIAPGPRFPALVSAMASADGSLCALHYTFLAADGAGKAPVPKAKLMWPSVEGLAVRVTHGPSGLNCTDAAAKGQRGILALTEGIEDAMSAAVAYGGRFRIHAAGSLPGLLSQPDLECASAYLVFKDNDWGKGQAQHLFSAAVARLARFGKPVEVVAMPAAWGKDVNDAINF